MTVISVADRKGTGQLAAGVLRRNQTNNTIHLEFVVSPQSVYIYRVIQQTNFNWGERKQNKEFFFFQAPFDRTKRNPNRNAAESRLRTCLGNNLLYWPDALTSSTSTQIEERKRGESFMNPLGPTGGGQGSRAARTTEEMGGGLSYLVPFWQVLFSPLTVTKPHTI